MSVQAERKPTPRKRTPRRKEARLGVDPGLNNTGLVLSKVLRNGRRRVLEANVVDVGTWTNMFDERQRYKHASLLVMECIFDFLFQNEYFDAKLLAVIENPFVGQRSYQTAFKSVRYIQQLEVDIVDRFEIPVVRVAPTQVKKAVTGNGTASKEMVADAVQTQFRPGDWERWRKKQDVTDAAAIASTV